MQFHFGGIPEPIDFLPDETWNSLREPNPWLMQLFAIPIGAAMFVATGLLWFQFEEVNLKRIDSPEFLFVGLLTFIPLIVVHEMIHALIHPQSGRSPQTILGFWPSKLLFYAHYDGELTRNRFIAILLMPAVIITCAPLAFAIITGLSNVLVAWLSAWNIFFACGDVFGICLLLFQVPKRARCRNRGWRTYWKIPPVPTVLSK